MATVTGYTAQRMKRIEDETVVDGEVVGPDLILITRAGTQINAGPVQGPVGPTGPAASAVNVPYAGAPGMVSTNVEGALDELAAAKVPAGSIITWAGTVSVPAGWLVCDGAEYVRANYAALFAAISTSYGVGNNVSTFNVPNLKGRIPAGLDAGQAEFNAIAKVGGAKTHALTVSELASHDHAYQDAGHQHLTGETLVDGGLVGFAGGGGKNVNTATAIMGTGIVILANGGNAPHNNLQPYITMRYLIKS
jgi:microcystin-dependent protein